MFPRNESAHFSTFAGPPVNLRDVVITKQLVLVLLLIKPPAKPVWREPDGTISVTFARAAPFLRRDGLVERPRRVHVKDSIQRFRGLFKGRTFLDPRLIVVVQLARAARLWGRLGWCRGKTDSSAEREQQEGELFHLINTHRAPT